VADCLRALKFKQDVKFLGSYPAGGKHAPSARDDADASWAAALRQRPGTTDGVAFLVGSGGVM